MITINTFTLAACLHNATLDIYLMDAAGDAAGWCPELRLGDFLPPAHATPFAPVPMHTWINAPTHPYNEAFQNAAPRPDIANVLNVKAVEFIETTLAHGLDRPYVDLQGHTFTLTARSATGRVATPASKATRPHMRANSMDVWF